MKKVKIKCPCSGPMEFRVALDNCNHCGAPICGRCSSLVRRMFPFPWPWKKGVYRLCTNCLDLVSEDVNIVTQN